jgi:hypothetical protein
MMMADERPSNVGFLRLKYVQLCAYSYLYPNGWDQTPWNLGSKLQTDQMTICNDERHRIVAGR